MTSLKVLPAAATLSLSFVVAFSGDVTPAGYFESPIGAQRAVPLPDGSTITLNTDSRIRIWGPETNLHVDMLRGEALFDMKANPRRHLTVSAYDIELIDQGTIFDIRLVTNRTVRVTVQEGRVQLTTTGSGAGISLETNQQTTVDYTPTPATLRTRKVSPDSIQHQLSWRRGVLDFDCVKLGDAIDEINRYNLLQMQLVGPIAGDDRISGAGFAPTDPTLFAQTAAAVIPNMTWAVVHRSGQPPLLRLHQSSRPVSADSVSQRCTPHDAQDVP